MVYIGIYHVLFVVYSIFLLFRSFITSQLFLTFKPKNSAAFRSWLFFVIFVASAIFVDLSWILKATRTSFFPAIDYKIYLFFIRIAWGCMALQYQALTLFISSLLEKNHKTRLLDCLLSVGNVSIFLCFVGLALFQFNCPTLQDRPAIEPIIQRISSIYILLSLIISTLVSAMRLMRSHHLPRILRRQLKIFLGLLVMPCILFETMQLYPFNFPVTWATGNLAVVALTALLLTYMMYYCMRKVMGLRLFNAQEQVSLGIASARSDTLKRTIASIESLQHMCEIKHVVQSFLKEAFQIPTEKIRLYIRTLDSPDKKQAMQKHSRDEEILENFITNHATLLKNKILVADEVEFSNAYEEHEAYKAEIALLHMLNADIFIPIYEQNTMSAYIIIERDARRNDVTNGLYDCSEQDQMQILAGVLGHAITALARNELRKLEQEIKHLNQKNQEYQKQQEKYEEQLERQYQENKTVRDELAHRLHEIDQYREGISQFIFHDPHEHCSRSLSQLRWLCHHCLPCLRRNFVS
jgi:hypothetical protein